MSKNDVVIINLDRPRELRFGHKALKTLTALTGKSLEELDLDDKFDMEELEKIFYCGLLSDARENKETLKLEDMEDLLDLAPMHVLLNSMQMAFSAAFGQMEVDEKNFQRVVEQSKKTKTK